MWTKDKSRFELVSKESHSLFEDSSIIKDTQTGVLYMFFQNGEFGGLTPLLDGEGKPIVEPANS